MTADGAAIVETLRAELARAKEQARVSNVGERSNFKKIPTHTQDHGDAQQREGGVLSTYPRRPKRKR